MWERSQCLKTNRVKHRWTLCRPCTFSITPTYGLSCWEKKAFLSWWKNLPRGHWSLRLLTSMDIYNYCEKGERTRAPQMSTATKVKSGTPDWFSVVWIGFLIHSYWLRLRSCVSCGWGGSCLTKALKHKKELEATANVQLRLGFQVREHSGNIFGQTSGDVAEIEMFLEEHLFPFVIHAMTTF